MTQSTASGETFGAYGRPFRWRPASTATDKDAIRILDKWPEANITSFACEELGRWTKGRSRIVTMNHSVGESFLKLWARWEREGVLEVLPPEWGGAWCARYKRGAAHDGDVRHLSNHASGHAFDICPTRYPLNKVVDGPDPIQALVPIARELGWRWGGDFTRPDPMHFQHVSSPFP